MSATPQMEPVKTPQNETVKLIPSAWTNFQNICSSVQSLVTAIALVIAGVWAWHTWQTQRSDRIAGQQAALEITVTAHQGGTSGKERNNGFLIQGDITVLFPGGNNGRRPGPLAIMRSG